VIQDCTSFCQLEIVISGQFFDIQCVFSISTHILYSTSAKISCWSILGIFKLGPLAFCVIIFCHPFGGRDSLKKANIPEEWTGGSYHHMPIKNKLCPACVCVFVHIYIYMYVYIYIEAGVRPQWLRVLQL